MINEIHIGDLQCKGMTCACPLIDLLILSGSLCTTGSEEGRTCDSRHYHCAPGTWHIGCVCMIEFIRALPAFS